MRRTFVAVILSLSVGCGPEAPDDVSAFSSDPGSTKQGYMLGIGAPEAWEAASGSALVAIIDNGVDVDHPDLKNKAWTNPDELPNGVDDDGDGHIDDIHGWNFLDNNGDVTPSSEASDHRSHGTAVAGIIAAETNNSLGVAACCPACRFIAIKARDFEAAHTVMPRLAEAINYAVARGARVINVSDGALPEDVDPSVAAEVEAALKNAAESGVLVVASAGNDGREIVRWPARIPGVLAVGAVDWEGQPTPWTSYGPEVDVTAPGVFVWTTAPSADYAYFDGTSAAAPVAAALAAMITAARPDWSVEQVAARVRETAKPAASGAGEVDFAAAMRDLPP